MDHWCCCAVCWSDSVSCNRHWISTQKAALCSGHQAFDDAYMEVVKMGDALFHGGGPQKELGITLTKTGMACAMCHPFASDVHPHQFPKFQEQMSEVAGLREMINWCIEKPNEGVKIGIDSEAMIALEAYINWSHKGTVFDPGTH
jgi:thiosulfate dehydrogenase